MVQIRVGDIVTVRPKNYSRAGSGYRNATITDQMNESGKLRVTRVYSSTAIVRGPINVNGSDGSFTLWKHEITSVNGIDPETNEAPVKPRKLGEKPADTDDVPYIHIGIDDPGIQWLFEDMAAFADKQIWCRQYDDLCEQLGIPGREQDWEVEVTRGDITMYATITAHTYKDAQAKLEALLVDAE
jgi:hypothetical protein